MVEERLAELAKKLIPITLKYRGSNLDKVGDLMFDLETQEGLPPEITFDKIKSNYSNEELTYIIWRWQVKRINHKVLSGIGEERLKNIQNHNNKILTRFLDKGEFDL